MALPPVPYQTDFQDKKMGRITQPWLQWLEQLRNTLNRLVEGQGTTLHEALTDVTSDQHHAEAHTHETGTVTEEVTYGQAPSEGVLSTVSRSDHTHGSVSEPTNLRKVFQTHGWIAGHTGGSEENQGITFEGMGCT